MRIRSSMLGWALALVLLAVVWQPVQQSLVVNEGWKSLMKAANARSAAPAQLPVMVLPCTVDPIEEPAQRLALRNVLDSYERLTAAAPNNRAGRLAGQAYCLLGEYDQARHYFETAHKQLADDSFVAMQLIALQQKPGSSSPADSKRLARYITLQDAVIAANYLVRAGKQEEALTWVKVAYSIKPEEQRVWTAWRAAGLLSENERDWETAQTIYREALQAQEKAGVSVYRGSFYLRLGINEARLGGHTQTALDYYQQAEADGHFVSDKDRSFLYERRALWHWTNRESAGSGDYLADYLRSLELNPELATSARMIGMIYQVDHKDYGQAEKYLQLAISLAPHTPEPYYFWGNLLFEQEKYREALEAYDQAIERKSDYKAALDKRKAAIEKLEGKP